MLTALPVAAGGATAVIRGLDGLGGGTCSSECHPSWKMEHQSTSQEAHCELGAVAQSSQLVIFPGQKHQLIEET